MGQHINKVTYYTSQGIYEIPVDNLYVPKKAGQTVKVADAKVSAGEAEITVSNLPTDFSPEYKIDRLDFSVENGKIVFKNAKKGKYTLTVSDKNNNYAEMTTTFILSADSAPASYNNDNENPAITKNADASDEEFADYIKNITSVSVNGKSYAASGRGAVKVINEDGSLKTDATPFAEGDTFEIAVTSTGYPEVKFTYTKNAQEEYKYVYAAMTWAEYWAAEGVQAAGDSSSSSELDTRNEADKGAFDAVTRATANHGLHRGSFQCVAVIEAENGKTYEVSHWSADGKEITLTNGNVIKFNRGEITDTDGTITKLKDYEVTGLKYVPVKVASADYEAFCQKYNVVENGGELVGGYGENKLAAYSVKANVTEATNGLKTVTKDEKGNFSFSARQAGSDSGIEGQTLKTAPDATEAGLTVKDAKGSYGEFLRVDLTGNYGDLGANMQAVTWTYYGNDSTYSNVKATYGTKFAADNWMHKTKGIQLALTKSLRCTLPEGTDGTGYWTITIAALGYKDVTYQFQATDANIVKDSEEEISTDELKKAIEAAEALTESDYTADSWAAMQAELQEAKDELKDPKTQATVDEATHHLNAAIEALVKAQKETYVLMNIPYDQFYKADVNNDVKVDAFTSATKNKVRTGSLAGGSYHVDASGDEITGVTFPVKVPAGTDLSKYTQITDDSKVSITVTNRGQESTTDYTGKDALFESASYSYYTLSEKPSYYKELTVNEDGTFSFGATQGTATTITEGVTAELMTESKYGDYQLDLDGLTDTIPSGTAIYGVIVSTKEGSDYGMRHLENIWRVSELAWATGFTTAVHNCPTSSEHYKSMMGKTIDSIEYYTTNGVYTMDIADIYVPVKSETTKAEVADADITTGKTTISVQLPDEFDPEYSVDGLDVSVEGNVLTFKATTESRAAASVKPGKYTLTIKDKNKKYADVVTTFTLTTKDMPAAYDEENKKLVEAEGFDIDALKAYLGNITSVNVNGKDYAASGRGSVVIINKDGTIKTDADPFKDAVAGTEFQITVASTGYTTPLTFTYKIAETPAPAEVDTTALEAAIAEADNLKEADYTAESWSVYQAALQSARTALEAKESQDAVDQALAALNAAKDALVKAEEEPVAINTASLEKAIADAKAIKEADYTAESWKALQSALSDARKALEAKESQEAVDNATNSLNKAIKALVKKGSSSVKKTDGTTNGSKTSGSDSVKTGDPASVLGWLGLAVSSLGAGMGGFAWKRRKKIRLHDNL